MNDKLLGCLMNSLAACAVNETIRISLSLTASSLLINDNHQVCFVKTPKDKEKGLQTTYRRLCDSVHVRLFRSAKLRVVQLLVKQLSLLPHLGNMHCELASQAGVDVMHRF